MFQIAQPNPDDDDGQEPEECEHYFVKHRCQKCGDATNEDTNDHYER